MRYCRNALGHALGNEPQSKKLDRPAFLSHFFAAMKINSTASYAPSYTANYGDAQSAQSKAATKITVKSDGAADQARIADIKNSIRHPEVKQRGVFLNARA